MDWKDNLDPMLRHALNEIIHQTLEYRDAYKSSSHPRTSQIWVAIALLYIHILRLESKLDEILKKLEALKEIDKERLLKTLEQF